MPSIADETIFSEPSGWPFALIQFGGAFLLLSVYLYYVIVENSTSGSWILFMILGAALSGIAESLPKPRRRAAGALRLTAIFVLVCFLAIMFLAPEFIIRWQKSPP